MLVLVMDSASPAVTAALVRVGDTVELVAQRVTVDARAHGERLAPQITDVLRAGSVTPGEVDAIVAGLGPGPFTGLRVGLVTATAMGHALGIPTYGVCSLDGLGHGLPGRVLVATDARRKEVYWAVYADGERIEGPEVARPDALRPEAIERAVGDGALKYAETLGLPVDDEPRYPVAVRLAEVAAERILAKSPTERLNPLYLRRPDAVAPGERKPALR